MASDPDPVDVAPVDGPAFPTWLALLAVLVAATIWWRFGRQEFTATRAYRQLRRRMQALDPTMGPAVAPLALARRLGDRFPAAAPPAGSLLRLYLRESFGGERLDGEELQRVRALLKQAFSALRRQKSG